MLAPLAPTLRGTKDKVGGEGEKRKNHICQHRDLGPSRTARTNIYNFWS